MALTNVVDSKFGKQILKSTKPVLVSFRASYCKPSQDLVPVIDEIAEEYRDRVKFVAVDVDRDSAAIRSRLNVTRVPVTMMFDGGRVADFIGGRASRKSIVDMLERRLSPVIRVDEFNFENDVLNSKVPVLVHFDAAWCRASRALIPVIDDLAERYARKARFARVQFGPETTRICSQFGVRRVPTISLFVNGEIQDEILGGLGAATKVGKATSEDSLSQMLDAFI